ncbi:MAG: hypothetical protein GC155_11840 [Alphaproteobacteria bacterium]|nr:hypothetical protein [Alphaproteobacteria bacterium]
MKRLLLASATVLFLAGSVTAPALAQQGNYGQHNGQGDHDRGPPQGHDNGHDDRYDNRGASHYESRHDSRHDWRDDRHDARYDAREHNGYYIGRVWHRGPPPASAYHKRGFALGYKPWKRGDHLGYYSNRYVVVDYRAHHLKPPPRGYHWVQDDRGDFILAAIAGGLIASVIINAIN